MDGELVDNEADDGAGSEQAELLESHIADEAELVRTDVLRDRMLVHGFRLISRSAPPPRVLRSHSI